MIFIIILIAIVILFTVMIALYIEKNKPTELDDNTDSVDVIFDEEDKKDKDII